MNKYYTSSKNFSSIIVYVIKMKYSRRSILFFKSIAIVSVFFGLVPPYNFTERQIIYLNIYTTYTIILKTVWLCFWLILLVNQYQNVSNNTRILFFVFNLTITSLGYCVMLLVMTYSYKRSSKWKKMFDGMTSMESNSALNTRYQFEENLIKNPVFQFFTLIVVLIALIVCYFIFYHDSMEVHDTFRMVSFVYNFMISLVATNLSIAVKNKFTDINQKLQQSKIEQFYNAIQTVRTCRILYEQTGCIVNLLNDLFGLPIILMYFVNGIHILEMSSTLFVNMKKGLDVKIDVNLVVVLTLNIVFLVSNSIFCSCAN